MGYYLDHSFDGMDPDLDMDLDLDLDPEFVTGMSGVGLRYDYSDGADGFEDDLDLDLDLALLPHHPNCESARVYF